MKKRKRASDVMGVEREKEGFMRILLNSPKEYRILTKSISIISMWHESNSSPKEDQ